MRCVNKLYLATIAMVLAGCQTVSHPSPPGAQASVQRKVKSVTAIRYSPAGVLWYLVTDGETCELRNQQIDSAAMQLSDECDSSAIVMVEETPVVTSTRHSWWARDGQLGRMAPLFDAVAQGQVQGRDDGTAVWIHAGTEIELGPVSAARILPATNRVIVLRGDRRELALIDATGQQMVLYSSESAIDSFDVDPREKEIAFSVRNNGSLDVGLISTDSSAVSWVGRERTDERLVTWAPRGNKITYVAQEIGGTTLRSVHIPTSYQVAADFPALHVHQVSWEPKAEKFAAIVSSLVESPHVQTIRYAGEERSVVVAPAEKFDREIETIAIDGSIAAVIPPRAVRYGERYAAVIQFRDDAPWKWSDELAPAIREGTRGVIAVRGSVSKERIVDAVRNLGWIDADRLTFID